MERPAIRRGRRTSKIEAILADENNQVEAAPVDVIRPPLRDEDPRSRAQKRTEELLAHLGNDGLDLAKDDFYINPSIIPDGWDYEWKRRSVLNWEDTSHMLAVAHTGWQQVPTSRHPEMMPHKTKLEFIERKGLMLMERPIEITQRIKAAEARAARMQVLSKEQQLNETPNGTLDRTADSRTKANIKRSFDIPVPER